MSVILGIDLGTQSVKGVLIDAEKGVITAAGKDYEVLTPELNFAEEDPAEWWDAFKEVLVALKEKNPVEFAEIAAIGITGQMHGLVVLNKEHKPLMPAIIWVDQRSKKQLEEIYKTVDENDIKSHIHNRIFTGFALPSLLWIKEERPEIYKQIDKIISPKDYIRLKLTGELGCEATDASAMTMFDIPARNWYFDLTDKLGFDKKIFPECRESTETAGYVTSEASNETGLKKGIPVIFGSGDQSALLIGNGVYKEGMLASNIGTGGTMAAWSQKDIYDEKLRTHTFCNAYDKSYVVFGAILGGGISMRWLRDNILRAKDYEEMTSWAEEIAPGSGGMFFLPYLGGERTPHMNPDAQGMFFGLKLKQDRRYMVRSVMEGVVYALKDNLNIIEEMGVKIDKIIASGGGARSSLWLQIQADVFERDIYLTDAEEQAALGIAVLAGVGTGIFKDLEEGCGKLIHFKDKVYHPNTYNTEIYREGYEIFRELYKSNVHLMDKTANLFEK